MQPTGKGEYSFEARLTDRAFGGDYGGPSDTVIHDIEITGRLRGPELTVVSLTVTPHELPYRTCPTVAPAAAALVGASLRSGWRKTVLAHLGGAKGCTHMTTLLLGLAEITTQVIFLEMNSTTECTRESRTDGRWLDRSLEVEPNLLDVCFSLRRDSPVMIPVLDRRSSMGNKDES
ncbi:hypothetical protein GCM10009547_07740 [Sporichthya brevicatena]|uniref:DUF2889 domain-containing protein n=1 Tax=Sporichthya brevicatena TaxID=171442 RepID=A0ABP3RJA0_9ACTN